MKRVSFVTTARRKAGESVRKFGAGVLVMGLALTASAKDGVPAGADVSSAAGSEFVAASETPVAKSGLQTKGIPRYSKARRWVQIGVASWYGLQFQGRRTAGGEQFDMNRMTCAHPTLPMGTWVRVTNLKNRKTAFVRVNDRGPVLQGRIVDLSLAAARALGLAGVAKVRLDAVRDGDAEMARAMMAQVQMPELFALMSR
jgi:rare lipoprotein A